MAISTLDTEQIELLRNIPDLIPARWDNFGNDKIRIVDRSTHLCRNYLSANRRGFYKIVFLNEGVGIFTVGVKTYHIDEPTILFIHPNEIISWKNLTIDSSSTGHFCLFKIDFADQHSRLKIVLDKYGFFSGNNKSVTSLPEATVEYINNIFLQMHAEQESISQFKEDAIQAYIQLIMVNVQKIADYKTPDVIHDEYKHIYNFFQLLEKETTNINYNTPIRLKTAAEFANSLSIHPNYLNAILKKNTGQNLSIHIQNRLLEESKVFLLRTEWTLQNIGYAIGYADQPNFSRFFKKHTGITPAKFRSSYS